ncbi:class I SAM-dependent methyltransferase [Halosegnis marinus]|uniref:Class I SAM-dependent methyltransferase n=1 Tax=Halosegnis marinus TaxID=3034023 RepID=A0ABD5ZKM3_9EURY|nr:class I SAM-dependent methyltransferase [Halosegnis sp. DT85]
MNGAADRFAGTEGYYAAYRPDYPDALVADLADGFALGADARVLDLGCGTGRLAVPLARHASVVGMDPNPTMLDRARGRADAAGVAVEWVEGSDADLPPPGGSLRLTTMGRSFHWMEATRTLRRLDRATEPGGGVALVGDPEWLVRGTEPWQEAVYEVVTEFVEDVPERTGPVTYDRTWADVLAGSAFADTRVREYTVEREWTVEEAAGYVQSLSYCAGIEDRAAFEAAVRDRLGEGPYAETAEYRATVGVRR